MIEVDLLKIIYRFDPEYLEYPKYFSYRSDGQSLPKHLLIDVMTLAIPLADSKSAYV